MLQLLVLTTLLSISLPWLYLTRVSWTKVEEEERGGGQSEPCVEFVR